MSNEVYSDGIITFDDYKFRYVIHENAIYVYDRDIVDFISGYSIGVLLHHCSKIYDQWYNTVLKNEHITYTYNWTWNYVNAKLLIRLIMNFNPEKYLKYEEVIKQNFGYEEISNRKY
jgi:hypothetical protein